MIFSYNWLKDYVKNLPKPEKVAELLTMHSFEVSEVKKTGGDYTLDVDVLPNRAQDSFSHFGMAREIAAVSNLTLKPIDIKVRESNLKTADFVSVDVKDSKSCLRYTAKVMTDVKVGPSPKWLKDRLRVCGLNSINNIVDIANYVMLETGQPLHAFDAEKIEGKKIIVRFAKIREKIVTLDEQKFDLDPDILVIADAKKPVAIAGIKGGKIPEIDKKTKTIILESANFNPKVIRQGSKKLGIRTDASIRFENGIDSNLTEKAIERASYLIQKLASGKTAKGLIDIYPKKSYAKHVKLDLNYVESLLGIKISGQEAKSILKRLGFQIKGLMVIVPTFRQDISIPEDLVEEIGRIYGYEKIPSVFPVGSLVPPRRNTDIFWQDMAKNILKEAGFSEVYNYSFFSEKQGKTFGYGQRDLIELQNPLSQEQQYLRASLIPGLLKNVKSNLRHTKHINIFELGKIFENAKNSSEKRQLTGLVFDSDFYQLKGVVDLLLQKLAISNIWYDEHKATPEHSNLSIWHAQRLAEIKVDNQEVGFLGEISPKILHSLDIKAKVVVFDIDFEKLQKLASEEHQYMPLSKFPSAVRDLAVLVPQGTKVVQVLNKINAVGGEIIKDVDLFDVYEGEELPNGKKNLAFHIIYQSKDRTLKSKEVDEIHKKIIKTLEKDPTWQVRK